ncbi:MAG TPA: hypothetical protein VMW67_06920 [Desulfobacteria bacterium]|nr:hypothetical protein [Desulfobacteria bacterium]
MVEKIRTEKREIVAHGVFLTFEDEPTIMTLDLPQGRIDLEFVFKEDDSKKIWSNHELEETKMRLEFFNFDDVLGASNKNPILLLTSEENDIYANFIVSKGSESKSRKVVYTLYSVIKK